MPSGSVTGAAGGILALSPRPVTTVGLAMLAGALLLVGCPDRGRVGGNGGAGPSTYSGDAEDAGWVLVDGGSLDVARSAEDAGGELDAGGAAEDAGVVDAGPPPCLCSDGDPCTDDGCNADGACVFKPSKSAACAPEIAFEAPPRAATVYGTDALTPLGLVSAPAGILELTAQDAPVFADAAGEFEGPPVMPVHGINVLTARVKDNAEVTARAVQAFIAGEAFYPTTNGDTVEAGVQGGMLVFLGPEAWAAVAGLVAGLAESLDLTSLLSKTLFADGQGPGIAWCEWAVVLNDIGFEVSSLTLVPVDGGLALTMSLSDVFVDFSATDPTFLCPDAVGTITSSQVLVSVVLHVSLTDTGAVVVSADEVLVDVAPPKVDFTTGVASLLDWAVNLFDGTIAKLVESQVAQMIQQKVGPLVQSVVAGFAADGVPFEVPSLAGVTAPLTLTLGLTPTWLQIDQTGMRLGLTARVTAPKGLKSLVSPGSIARNGCLHGSPQPYALQTGAPLSLALHDDLLNELLFAAWWGGAMNVDVPPEVLDGFLANTQADVSEVSVLIDAHLPPVITSCTADGTLELQLGDLRLVLSAKLKEASLSAELWVSAKVAVTPEVQIAEDGTAKVALKVEAVKRFDYELVKTGGVFEGAEAALDGLVGGVVESFLADQVAGAFVPAFPLPQIDLGALVPGVPEGTLFTLLPVSLAHENAYTALQGQILVGAP